MTRSYRIPLRNAEEVDLFNKPLHVRVRAGRARKAKTAYSRRLRRTGRRLANREVIEVTS